MLDIQVKTFGLCLLLIIPDFNLQITDAKSKNFTKIILFNITNEQ